MDSIQLIRSKILVIVLIVWVALWGVFTGRELFIKGNIRDYRALAVRSLDEKRSYITGERLYSFITFCKANLPAGATYQLVGVEDGSLDKRRATYYLYPLMETDSDPDYILVFGLKGFSRGGYSTIARMDDESYVLMREGAR